MKSDQLMTKAFAGAGLTQELTQKLTHNSEEGAKE
jgi:hypothetical protein